jgi:hypothetical protein
VESFYQLDEKTRMKIIRKIPLGILYRIENYKEKRLFNKYVAFTTE